MAFPVYFYQKPPVAAVIPPTPPTTRHVGWFAEWGKKRTIPIERLREILKEQGSPWAKELADAVEAPIRSPKHREVVEEVVQRIARPEPGVDWESVTRSLQAAAGATRATLAIKRINDALAALQLKAEQEARAAEELRLRKEAEERAREAQDQTDLEAVFALFDGLVDADIAATKVAPKAPKPVPKRMTKVIRDKDGKIVGLETIH